MRGNGKMAKIPTELVLTVAVILGLGSILLAQSNFVRSAR